ncbi:sensor histidine kinase [Inhella sp.]|uniref:sensor histidine kinase n=1 Tax=Inhella sp. TaxID=1921806 RepID=UPI0035B1F666
MPSLPMFEVCQAGTVLRALLGVQGVLALVVALDAQSSAAWQSRFLLVCAVSVPALMSWLLVVCALRLRLAAWPPLQVRGALLLLGALCAWLPWWLGQQLEQWLGSPGGGLLLRGAAVAATGAVSAWALLAWLSLRAQAQGPTGLHARWVELQSRIRPHFLFNTLNTAVALVRINPTQAERVLEDLAELFRAALAAPDWTSTLAEEVTLAQRYLDIEQLRFGERLRVRWDLDPACDAARVPPLLLQPLVENAVRYGVEPNEAGGELLVRTRLHGGEVELLVRNSVLASAPGGHGLALANVRERLRLLHDLAARLQIESEGERFAVRITLPKP